MNPKKKEKKNLMICIVIFCLIALGLSLLYLKSRPLTTAGSKKITVEVIYEDSTKETYTAQTQAIYLEQAISDMDGLVIDGSRSEPFGLMILTVNGVEADYMKHGAYWSILLEDTPCNYGVSKQPVQDGAHYRPVYTRGEAS